MARTSLPSPPGWQEGRRDITRNSRRTLRILDQTHVPGNMSHPLEKPCLRLGSGQQGSDSDRLARTEGVTWGYTQAHPPGARMPSPQLDTRALQQPVGVPGEPGGWRKPQASTASARSPLKSARDKTRLGP